MLAFSADERSFFEGIIEGLEYQRLDDFEKWWNLEKITWRKKLKKISSENGALRISFQLNAKDLNAFQEYYHSIKTIIDCLNSDCYVTKATRQYIEDTLLLPLSEIEKYPVPDAIANL